MKDIHGKEKSLRELLMNEKYTLHYYQREYRWQEKQIQEMLDDLTSEFLAYYKPDHVQADVKKKYGIYFMGSIVLAGYENAIIDGQQRLSSLTLLLMYLNNRLHANGQPYPSIEGMIFSEAGGKTSFNIDVSERQACMEAIFKHHRKDNLDTFDTKNATESVKNLCDRYNDIVNLFSVNNITDDMILVFCEWLMYKVSFIEIVAGDDQDAHKIFVTMNDRGLNLTSSEMLKGYLLAGIDDDDKRQKFNEQWKNMVLRLKKGDDKGDETFIRAWLRAQYAVTIRKKEAKAQNEDYDIIGGQFHKWILDNNKKLGLNSAADFEQFIEEIFYFARVYRYIRAAENKPKEDTEYVFCNAQLDFTLQPQLLMAPICRNDNDDTVTKKINLTARFIDLYINARIINSRSLAYSTIKDRIFEVTKKIRRLPIDELKSELEDEIKKQYAELNYNPEENLLDFGLNKRNKKYIKNILARITSFIEEKTLAVKSSKYRDYMNTQTKNPYEIEHILCDHFELFTNEFADEKEFADWRNRIGALLLLHKSINASLSDSDYDKKLIKYCSTDGNIYAASLGKQTYQNNPRFKNFIAENNLSFEPFDTFGKAEIEKRTRLVVELVNLIWNAEEFQ